MWVQEADPNARLFRDKAVNLLTVIDNKYIQIFSIVAFQGDLLDSPHTVRVFVTVNKQFPYLCSNLSLINNQLQLVTAYERQLRLSPAWEHFQLEWSPGVQNFWECSPEFQVFQLPIFTLVSLVYFSLCLSLSDTDTLRHHRCHYIACCSNWRSYFQAPPEHLILFLTHGSCTLLPLHIWLEQNFEQAIKT